MARLALLCLACRAASGAGSTGAYESRRLSATDYRTFRGKLDPPAAGRGRHHLEINTLRRVHAIEKASHRSSAAAGHGPSPPGRGPS